MITYPDLVKKITELHAGPIAAPLPLAIAGEWIPSVVDSSSAKVSTKQVVLVAVGANYATDPGKLPSKSPGVYDSVEAKLGPCRKRAKNHIIRCAKGKTKRHWNGLLPFDPDKPSSSTDTLIKSIESGNFHFVMTNLSPWITFKDWAKIRDNRIEDIFSILAQPGIPNGMLNYFKGLKKIVGRRDAIWIGHGNAEVYGIFRYYCWMLGINPSSWFFDSNLSQKSCF